MQSDAIQPIGIVGISSLVREPKPFIVPTKGKRSDLPSPPEVRNPVGNTVGPQETDKALLELSQAIERFNVSLKFTKDEETGKIVIEMIDQTSGDTLLQIPNAATLHVAATLSKLQGRIFNCRA